MTFGHTEREAAAGTVTEEAGASMGKRCDSSGSSVCPRDDGSLTSSARRPQGIEPRSDPGVLLRLRSAPVQPLPAICFATEDPRGPVRNLCDGSPLRDLDVAEDLRPGDVAARPHLHLLGNPSQSM